MFTVILFICFNALLTTVETEDVKGCGGFVKIIEGIDVTKIKLSLYSYDTKLEKINNLKFSSECAPNNGYYFIPIYKKGSYILKLESALDWNFHPTEILIHFDEVSDICSLGKDINFTFKGFTIFGQVKSLNSSNGPSNITISLYDSSKVHLESKLTLENGYYFFKNIMPGTYIIEASHSWRQFENNTLTITVKNDSIYLQPFHLRGYYISGFVMNEDVPVKNVHVILISQDEKDFIDNGCSKLEAAKFIANVEGKYVLCHNTSDSSGHFIFHGLAPGYYSIQAYYSTPSYVFKVIPNEINVLVVHENIDLKQYFQIHEFEITGQIHSNNEQSIVFINGNEVTKTENNGSFKFTVERANNYTIDIKSENYWFETKQIFLTPLNNYFPNIFPHAFRFCGIVNSEYIKSRLQTIAIFKNESKLTSITISDNGSFCGFLPPGHYSLVPELEQQDIDEGVSFVPEKLLFYLSNKPELNLKFSLLKPSISGKLICIDVCPKINVIVLQNTEIINKMDVVENFVFHSIRPGKYNVQVDYPNFCWKDHLQTVEVTSFHFPTVVFIQSGYKLSILATHSTQFHYQLGVLNIFSGENEICLKKKGAYNFTSVSCHQFEKSIYYWDTVSYNKLNLIAVKHKVSGTIVIPLIENDIAIEIVNSEENANIVKLDQIHSNDTHKVYCFEIWVKPFTNFTLKSNPKNSLIIPFSYFVTVNNDCILNGIHIVAALGIVIKGSIEPKLEEVNIIITSNNPNESIIYLKTNSSGQYETKPMDSNFNYSVDANYPGFTFFPVDNSYNFKAVKLAEIKVHTKYDDGNPISNVLLTLSGGLDFRQNKLTNQNGIFTFEKLNPGTYFLKPFKKEFEFNPASQIIHVHDGEWVVVNVTGKRIAFSCSGVITTLNELVEPGILVEAIGQNECSQFSEETMSESDGNFVLTGLLPTCEYRIQMKLLMDNEEKNLTIISMNNTIKIKDGDILGLHFYILYPSNYMDVSCTIKAAKEYLSSLNIILLRESKAQTKSEWIFVYRDSLESQPLFFMPRILKNNDNYLIRLESTLSHELYSYVEPEVYFTANVSFRSFIFHFDPQKRFIKQQTLHRSYLTLPITIFLIFTLFYHQTLFVFCEKIFKK